MESQSVFSSSVELSCSLDVKLAELPRASLASLADSSSCVLLFSIRVNCWKKFPFPVENSNHHFCHTL
jgi:hypothetical protein